MDPETQARRFEQQLRALEQLHADELRALEEKLAAYIRLHAGEVRLLREQLDELRQALSTVGLPGRPGPAAHPSQGRPTAAAPTVEEVNL